MAGARVRRPPQEKPEAYAASSPITYADQVQAPILIIQGRNDPRCPPGQMGRYVATMKAFGKAVEVHWLDEGHVAARAEAEGAIKNQELMLRFAHRILSQ